jgi:hypothetical protein
VVGLKIGYTEKQIGRMTMRKFFDLYDAYKRVFDIELDMKQMGSRYRDLGAKSIDDVIPF